MAAMEITDHHGQSTEFQAQFSEMLRPIKELDKNWAVDLASYLQKYLEMFVQQSQSSVDQVKLNFAQAAMLIQGSAYIYSKKVQFLYNLTFELYEQLVNKKKSSGKQNNDSQESQDSNADVQGSVVEQYLSLDDIPANNNLNRGGNRLMSTCTRTSAPSLLAMQDDLEKDNCMLINIKGSELGNKNDANMNRFLIGAIGFLLSYGSVEDMALQSRPVSGAPPPPEFDAAGDQSMGHHQDFDADASVFHDGPASPLPSAPPELPESTEKRTRQSRARGIISPEKAVFGTYYQNHQNPHEDGKSKERLLKDAKVHRLPMALRKRPHSNQEAAEEPENEENRSVSIDIPPMDARLIHSVVYSNLSKFPKNPLKTPRSIAFYQMYWDQHKYDHKVLAEINKKRKCLNTSEVDDDEEQENNEPFHDGGPEPDFADDESENQINFEDIPINQFQSAGDRFDSLALDSQNVPVVMTYEELAREQISQFHERAAKFHCGTDIGKRVSEWEDMIQPLLDEEETHRAYDIHEYGSEILECFEDNNRKQTLPFVNIVKGKKWYDIPRYFLSSLMLANSYNVELTTKGILEEGMDSLELTLLSRRRHHEQIQDFAAQT